MKNESSCHLVQEQAQRSAKSLEKLFWWEAWVLWLASWESNSKKEHWLLRVLCNHHCHRVPEGNIMSSIEPQPHLSIQDLFHFHLDLRQERYGVRMRKTAVLWPDHESKTEQFAFSVVSPCVKKIHISKSNPHWLCTWNIFTWLLVKTHFKHVLMYEQRAVPFTKSWKNYLSLSSLRSITHSHPERRSLACCWTAQRWGFDRVSQHAKHQ